MGLRAVGARRHRARLLDRPRHQRHAQLRPGRLLHHRWLRSVQPHGHRVPSGWRQRHGGRGSDGAQVHARRQVRRARHPRVYPANLLDVPRAQPRGRELVRAARDGNGAVRDRVRRRGSGKRCLGLYATKVCQRRLQGLLPPAYAQQGRRHVQQAAARVYRRHRRDGFRQRRDAPALVDLPQHFCRGVRGRATMDLRGRHDQDRPRDGAGARNVDDRLLPHRLPLHPASSQGAACNGGDVVRKQPEDEANACDAHAQALPRHAAWCAQGCRAAHGSRRAAPERNQHLLYLLHGDQGARLLPTRHGPVAHRGGYVQLPQ
mmetsp:Transcript_3321/g.7396  ORF Transcript_3321/g.7396 Transcript_3321/m.7396 type:complete len:318 (-) Transcript_3321:704-1657(-)